MATQSPSRRFNAAEFAKILVIGVVLGVGIPYAYIQLRGEAQPSQPPAVTRTPTAPPTPPKIDFLEAGTLTGKQSSFTKGEVHGTADLGPDDATVVWLKVETPAGAPNGQGGRGGGGGGRRGGGLPLMIKDAQGEDYSYSVERKDGGLMALHLKKGYDKKPDFLTVTENSGQTVVATWKINNVPAPTLLLPDSALQGQPLGEILLKPGRRGRLGASVHLTAPLPKDQGVILTPVAASYTPIDTSRPGSTLISKAGESPFDGPVNFPNPKMAHRVSFDMQTYQGVTSTETVTFHTAHIESPFGQPTLIVDKPEVVTTSSGLKVTLVTQNSSPKRQPKHVHSMISVNVAFDPATLKGGSVAGIAPSVAAELAAPSIAELGLEQVHVGITATTAMDGDVVFSNAPPASPKGVAGTVKVGPIGSLTLKITIIRPKLLAKKRIVLPVNPKVLPADPSTGPVGATPRPI